jgi:hypothetical protein
MTPVPAQGKSSYSPLLPIYLLLYATTYCTPSIGGATIVIQELIEYGTCVSV